MWRHLLNTFRLGLMVTWLRIKYRFFMWQGKFYKVNIYVNYCTNAINIYTQPKRAVKYISLRFVAVKDGVEFQEIVNGDKD